MSTHRSVEKLPELHVLPKGNQCCEPVSALISQEYMRPSTSDTIHHAVQTKPRNPLKLRPREQIGDCVRVPTSFHEFRGKVRLVLVSLRSDIHFSSFYYPMRCMII